MISRALIACLLAVALSGCGAGTSPFAPATGTVSGHVQTRACGGVYRPEQTGCPARPMIGAKVTFQLIDGSSTSTATTDSSGAYRIDLKPGTYMVQASEGPAKSALAGPRTVTVVAGKTVTADFIYTIQLL
jgi:hypothetical protein